MNIVDRLWFRLLSWLSLNAGSLYRRVYMSTTGRPWTHIMRERPFYLLVSAAVLLSVAFWFLPRRYWGRALFGLLSCIVGLMIGHVFW